MSNHQSRSRGSLVIGIVLAGLGAIFLLGQLFDVNLGRFLWPFFIIIPGMMFFAGMVLGGKSTGPLAIPGSIVTMVGILLLYQSIFNHFESWAYAWSLIFPTAIGIGLMINGAWSENDRLLNVGLRWAGIGVAIFLVLGVFFELILNISGTTLGSIVWPLALIAFGAYMLIRQGSREKQKYESITEIEKKARIVEEAPPKPTGPEFEPLDMNRGKNK